MDSSPTYMVKDLSLAEKGLLNIELAEHRMPALLNIRERLMAEKPFHGFTIGMALSPIK
jgi:adenosylhomocysteinase